MNLEKSISRDAPLKVGCFWRCFLSSESAEIFKEYDQLTDALRDQCERDAFKYGAVFATKFFMGIITENKNP